MAPPPAWQDHVGILTADARSAATVWDVLAGRRPDEVDATPAVLSGLVVGLPTDQHWRPADPEIAAAVAATAAALESTGARLVEVTTPGVTQLVADYATIVGAEAYTTHAPWLASRREDYQEITASRLMQASQITASEYIEARRSRQRTAAEIRQRLDGVDILLVPTTPIRATPIGEATVDGLAVRPALLSMCQPFNMLGLPALSIPGPVSDGGLPAGVQLVGCNVNEQRLLAVAIALGS